MSDPHDLQRFVDAQQPVYGRVLAELRAGQKTSHWMWFVFPQIAGLGRSPMAQQYAIASLAEARAYLAHTVLGARLRECTELMLAAANRPVSEILGYPDDMKFRSSMTLFALADESETSIFDTALRRFFNGETDPLTRQLVGAKQESLAGRALAHRSEPLDKQRALSFTPLRHSVQLAIMAEEVAVIELKPST